ncbi:MAG: Do family serine endopeptidase [Prevotellaceae bacterium]|jgi:Do/DeqQ family serine protease|nr:Do family serine endopeptidase [Prevotellaceae bacterium]
MNKNSILKTVSLLLFAGAIGGFVSALIIYNIGRKPEKATAPVNFVAPPMPVTAAAFSTTGEPVNFSDAAEHTVSSVVHVKVAYAAQKQYDYRGHDEFFEFFFGRPDRNSPQYSPEYTPRSSGSGVIISPDGYIVTNNHVVDKAQEITVVLNDKTILPAEVVGKDKSTDVALLKINYDQQLPALGFANSDNLRVGEWVLAVGNPFNLNSTVTAGIVSAKARSLKMDNMNAMAIESFIQTDAAVNPGNSGGALVNLKGELVGINTAIATNTGTFTGYSFAVPSNIVKKVVEDLMTHGVVQRAFLGIIYSDLSEIDENSPEADSIENLRELQKYKGAYINEIVENSAAQEAGLRKGDIITKIADKNVTGKSVILEEVGKLRPGDKVNLEVIRDGKTKLFSATLRNSAGNMEITTQKGSEILAAKLEPVEKELARKLKINGGLQVIELYDGKLKENGVRKGFIITQINQIPVASENDLINVLKNVKEKKGGVFIEGIYPNGRPGYIAFGL